MALKERLLSLEALVPFGFFEPLQRRLNLLPPPEYEMDPNVTQKETMNERQ